MDDPPVGRWVLIANVRELDRSGDNQAPETPLSGTKHFSPGTKVYCEEQLWGDGWESVSVVGRHRGNKGFVQVVMPIKQLCNFRAKQEFNPHIKNLLDGKYRLRLGGYTQEDQVVVTEKAHIGNELTERATHAVGSAGI